MQSLEGQFLVLVIFLSIGFVNVHRRDECLFSSEKVGATFYVICGKISVRGSNEMGNI